MFLEAVGKAVEVAGTVVEKTAEVSREVGEGAETLNESPIKDIIEGHIEEPKSEWKILKPNIEVMKTTSLEALVESNAEKAEATEAKKVGLTEDQKLQIKEETGWSDEIIDAIESMEQYEIYKNADLHEAEINGRKCLLKDIDLDYVDPDTGMTNRELMEKGRSPIDAKTGEKIELHHMGQNFDGPFVELAENSEHGDGNHKVLHGKMEDSWRNNPEQKNQYQTEKRNHWKSRAQGEV